MTTTETAVAHTGEIPNPGRRASSVICCVSLSEPPWWGVHVQTIR